jgi:gamma-glutamylputrescine oxidase|tara:strand:- start:1914 stop:3200 length:1287 start_codon:yes stop_codon:yes gene_type:complete
MTAVHPEHPQSYYLATAKRLIARPPLTGEVFCDVCVIGGGFTGLSSALNLAERGYRVVLLEARRAGWGASGRNGGQVGSGQRLSQASLEKKLGADDARLLWDLAEESKAEVKARIAKHDIDCAFKSGILHAAWKPGDVAELQAEVAHLHDRYHYPHLRFVPKAELREMLGSKVYHGGSLDLDAGHLHPLNFALGLAAAAEQAGAQIYEHSPAEKMTRLSGKTVIQTPGGQVKATHVVLGCNGYLARLEPRIMGQIMPINNFILATEPLGSRAREIIRDDVAVADTKFVIDYYRLSEDGRLLFGGGENYSLSFPEDIAGFVRKPMLRVFPQLADVKIDFAWGGTLAITINRMPAFGRLPGDIYYAQGYSGHGVAMATLAGKLIADALSGDSAGFDLMARVPTPRFPGGALLRHPLLVIGMLYHALLDRL